MIKSPTYIFASDTYLKKVNVDQPRGLRRFFGMGPRKSTATQWDTQMRTLLQQLESAGELGTLDEPKRFFMGQLELRWGPFSAAGADDLNLIYFGGRTDRAIVGLVGQSSGLQGPIGDSSLYSTSAGMRYLFTLLDQAIPVSPQAPRIKPFHRDHPQDSSKALSAVQTATLYEQRKGPTMKVEFCAQTLLIGEVNPWHDPQNIVLGIPLYIVSATDM
jgi:hypothetical protein